MSHEAREAVWKFSKSRGSARAVLLDIADHINSGTQSAFPSVPRLAERAKITPRAVNKILRSLCQAGELSIERGAGRNGTNLYRILLPHVPTGPASSVARSQPVDNFRSALINRAGAPEHTFPKGVNASSAEPVLNHKEPRNTSVGQQVKDIAVTPASRTQWQAEAPSHLADQTHTELPTGQHVKAAGVGGLNPEVRDRLGAVRQGLVCRSGTVGRKSVALHATGSPEGPEGHSDGRNTL